MEKFTMDNIHSGFVIELRNGHKLLAMRVHQSNFTKIFVYEHINEWYYATSWDKETLKYKGHSSAREVPDFDIMKVYGLITVTINYANANTTDIGGRKLLWERKEPRKIKMSQIRRLLGASEDEELLIEVDD